MLRLFLLRVRTFLYYDFVATGLQIKKQELINSVLQAVQKFERETGLMVIELKPQCMKTEPGKGAIDIQLETS